MKMGIVENDMRDVLIMLGTYNVMYQPDGFVDEKLSGSLGVQNGVTRRIFTGLLEISDMSDASMSFLKTVWSNPNGMLFEDENGVIYPVFWDGPFDVSWLSGATNICHVPFQLTEKIL